MKNTKNWLNLPLPTKPGQSVSWGNLLGASRSLAISEHSRAHTGPVIVVTPDSQTADQLEAECNFFLDKSALRLRDWETLPYDHFSPHEDIISERLSVLSQLPFLQTEIVILPISAFLQNLPPVDFIQQQSFQLKVKDSLDLTQIRKQLTAAGYHCVDQVFSHGEFTIRGAILDIFPMGSPLPFRVDLFDNEVESIRTFDPENQRSLEKITEINLLPAKEFPFNENAIKTFRKNWRETFHGNPTNCPIYQDVSEGLSPQGIEYYFPLFFNNTDNLFSYLPNNSLIFQIGDLQKTLKHSWDEIQHRYEQLRHDITRPILPPSQLFISEQDYFSGLKNLRTVHINTTPLNANPSKGLYNSAVVPMPTLSVKSQAKEPLSNLLAFLENTDRVLFCAESVGRKEQLLKLLHTANIKTTTVDSWPEFLKKDGGNAITVAMIDEGLYLPGKKIALITEAQLLGQKVLQRRHKKTSTVNPETLVHNLAELNVGNPVVHIDHGVGRYLGLQTLHLDDRTAEFLCIEYADNDRLYVPIINLDLISHYTGTDNPQIHRLSGDQWSKAKKKALKRIEDVAAELLDIYARREAKVGFSYKIETAVFEQFSDAFPFEETPDQLIAIDQIKTDMLSSNPTDRLVCGDVGFGKTEVAMRAAFIAVQNNKQVAVLVPTTLLAQQHFQSFQDRFADWPVNIEMLSRFRTPKEQKTIIEKLEKGKIDIIIGTHKLLQKDIRFNELGLLILDEEHRFGVKQKERIKSLRSDIDILALTATPIPRTLNMALGNIRDLSIISTPPAKRLSIKTFVHKHQPQIIVEAIRREILRGGQVFFLHNDVATIQNTADEIAKLIPEVRIDIGHGQMPERKLEKVMSDFYHRKFNVLVCTTIIETGIDIQSANTIIINRADKFGLAQLHQLRGRVGRSHHQAYAYLLIPDRVTKDAQKRLEAIQSLEDLGSGYILATHDLEIRGAGELLGDEQSGHITEIGFNLYMEMLTAAVNAIKSGKKHNTQKPLHAGLEIETGLTSLIPEDFIPNTFIRLQCYKRLSSLQTSEALDDFQAEMIDRFGLLPQALKNLFEITECKLTAKSLGIKKIKMHRKGGTIEFNKHPEINPTTILKLIQTQPDKFQLNGGEKLNVSIESTEEKRIQTLKSILTLLR